MGQGYVYTRMGNTEALNVLFYILPRFISLKCCGVCDVLHGWKYSIQHILINLFNNGYNSYKLIVYGIIIFCNNFNINKKAYVLHILYFLPFYSYLYIW